MRSCSPNHILRNADLAVLCHMMPPHHGVRIAARDPYANTRLIRLTTVASVAVRILFLPSFADSTKEGS